MVSASPKRLIIFPWVMAGVLTSSFKAVVSLTASSRAAAQVWAVGAVEHALAVVPPVWAVFPIEGSLAAVASVWTAFSIEGTFAAVAPIRTVLSSV